MCWPARHRRRAPCKVERSGASDSLGDTLIVGKVAQTRATFGWALPPTTRFARRARRRVGVRAAWSGNTTVARCNASGRSRAGGIASRPETVVHTVLVGEAGLACNRITRRVNVSEVGVADWTIRGAGAFGDVSTVVRTEKSSGARRVAREKGTRRAELRRTTSIGYPAPFAYWARTALEYSAVTEEFITAPEVGTPQFPSLAFGADALSVAGARYAVVRLPIAGFAEPDLGQRGATAVLADLP